VNDLFIHFANLKHCYWAQGLRGPIRTFKPTFSPQRGLQGALLYEGLVVHAVYVPYDSISLRPLKVPLKPSIRNCHPFGTAFHSDWLRNNPKGPHAPFGPLGPLDPLGVGGGGGVGWGAPMRASRNQWRLESLVAERIYSERLNWVGGMRVAYTLFIDKFST
jgi:hypothetical protein